MKPIHIVTRGSALALAQANFILSECQREFPELKFAIKVIRTTGDKLQSASLAQTTPSLPRGLFTKELEEALFSGEGDLAVHSLKDLPTTLPEGLKLGATTKRADARDILIYREQSRASSGSGVHKQKRGFDPFKTLKGLPSRACIGTSSNRRAAQIQEMRPDLRVVPLRGNVGTRLKKLSADAKLDAIVLAVAGLQRLGIEIDSEGRLRGKDVPPGLLGTILPFEEMLPCVGQAAIGIEIRENDEIADALCRIINHIPTWHCVTAERAFLCATGGGCQSAVAAYARMVGQEIYMSAVSFLNQKAQRFEAKAAASEARDLGERIAAELSVPQEVLT